MWNREASIEFLNKNSGFQSRGRCAEAVRKAIEAGGIKLHRHGSAKDYGASLLQAGFAIVRTPDAQTGDVVVIDGFIGHRHGHIAMFNGDIWVSDFKQNSNVYPGRSYTLHAPAYVIYRY